MTYFVNGSSSVLEGVLMDDFARQPGTIVYRIAQQHNKEAALDPTTTCTGASLRACLLLPQLKWCDSQALLLAVIMDCLLLEILAQICDCRGLLQCKRTKQVFVTVYL